MKQILSKAVTVARLLKKLSDVCGTRNLPVEFVTARVAEPYTVAVKYYPQI